MADEKQSGKQLTRNVFVDGTMYGPDGEKPTADVLKRVENEKAYSDDVDETPADKVAREQQERALAAASGKQQ